MSKKKLLAVLTGMVMAFMGLAGVGAASAVDQQPEKASLTVHKYLGATTNLKHDGTAIEAGQLPKAPLAGVNFKLYKVEGVDVSTNDGLKLAQQIGAVPLTDDVVTNGIKVGETTYKLAAAPTTETTDTNGEAKFAGVERGLYVVVEDLEGSTKIMNGQKEVVKEKITPIAPFAVTLPMTNPKGTAWNADVHVYPKNQENTLDKKVKDAGKHVGDDIVYTISTTSTGADLNGDGKMDRKDLGNVYEIVDTLDPNLAYQSVTVKVAGQDVTEGENGYQVTKEATGDPAQDKVTVSFKGTTLDTIAAGAKVELELTANVKKDSAVGVIPNVAKLYPNDWAKKNDKPVVSPEVKTKFGDIVIKKVDGAGKVLAGAKFSVHLDTSDNKDCSTYGDAIKTSEATGDNGLVSIKGLHLTNFVDNEDVAEGDQHPYCLVEEQAPAGYQLLPKAVKFSLTKEGSVTDLSAAAKAKAGNALDITNHKNLGLPLTGAQGILLVSVLGLILVSVGVVLTVKRRQD
ncbi:SpaH/EbpB family LPXTG-anchored major pilin [Varibaculum cambriense]|uniref:SpaH/EbpB family LPXTG-anchored major pilin n=1 Tax=Varibaculum cambriense TaxID=184870 RepID=UPI002912AFBF|nr:SpaH/EbpB family LPXTG-anchored major pilin [Varibaculum cambriense]MDU5542918.1 SpaH/EbpB family LPXTG-anchored major pilin [Varibaculum cambriense]